ncbi:migration and invasion-inhibitory protein [Myxocyprinus asiaticus]|uniref:migration and invasion-inhibitory protein n=1 Tax=Myxocyprinus asiaticus TaxID=70543 RepID=UPI002221DA48|nr:migration and invasion-inhibitory protein [Myxocyprinus asiaticus]
MAEIVQLDALRKRNKDLLEKLQKQTEKLSQLTLSRPDEEAKRQNSVCEAFTGGSDQRRTPLTERNGDVTAARASLAGASFSKAKTAMKTTKTSDERFLGDCEVTTPNQHKQSPEPATYSNLLQDAGNSRWKGHSRSERLMLPKSASLTWDTDQRETDSTTTLYSGLETDATSVRPHIQPLLGYDWIAGLLDAESSLTERSEQFFSELRSFRLVNRDECVYSSLSGPPFVADVASSSLEGDDLQQPPDTHQCTFCYRINSRLFAVPLDTQAACPVCKMPKPEHPHTETEPAFIRVSIPRSTLLPAYKYKAHRRCSFDPSDSLGLPSHCLSGWSNPTLNSGSQMSSLDLRGSIATSAATEGSTSCLSDNKLGSPLPKASRDQLLNPTRLPRHRFQHLDPKMADSHSPSYALLKSLH